LTNGIQLVFYTKGVENRNTKNEELIISAVLNEAGSTLELPFSVNAKSVISEDNIKNETINVHGVNWKFDSPLVNMKERKIVLNGQYPLLSYYSVPERAAFSPIEFVLQAGLETNQYEELLRLWSDKAFAYWKSQLSLVNNDENLVVSYISEAARRGSDAYANAISDVTSTGFTRSGAVTFLSTPYLGKTSLGMRSLIANDDAVLARIRSSLSGFEKSNSGSVAVQDAAAQQAVEKFLLENHPVEFLAVRGYNSDVDTVGNLVEKISPSLISVDQWPAVLEAWRDWFIWKPDTDNPWTPLVSDILSKIPDRLRKDSGNKQVYIIGTKAANQADILFNIRMGTALNTYGQYVGSREWAAIGRSIIVSALRLADGDGAVPAVLLWQEKSGDNTYIPQGSTKISALVIYGILSPSQYYPHAASLGVAGTKQAMWVWTAAPLIYSTMNNNTLEIRVTFMRGDAHYLLIRGVPSFSKIQLRNKDYRTDPSFESYDAPGWSYSAANQTLLIKLVHYSENEWVRIFF
jgi:hypothetical protein